MGAISIPAFLNPRLRRIENIATAVRAAAAAAAAASSLVQQCSKKG